MTRTGSDQRQPGIATVNQRSARQKIAKIIVLPRHRAQLETRGSRGRVPDLVIGAGVACKAMVLGGQTLQIDGQLEGEIRTNGTLLVGPQGMVKAQIEAGAVISRGRIVGAVRARESVRLLGTATLQGSVTTPTLTMDEGVRLETNWSLWIKGTKISGLRWIEQYQRGPIAPPAWGQ